MQPFLKIDIITNIDFGKRFCNFFYKSILVIYLSICLKIDKFRLKFSEHSNDKTISIYINRIRLHLCM